MPGLRQKAQQLPIVAQGVTLRATLVGLVLVAVLCIVTPYTDLVMRTSLIACNHLPIGVISLFLFMMLAINPLLRILPLKRPFSSAELITVYVMMLVAAGIPSFGLTEYLFPVVTAGFYYATPENKWQSMLHQYIPKWFGPRDDFSIKRFYEGLRPGETIPWGPWIKPLLGWSIFVFALYLVILCLAAILRKQWVEREKLSFPLVQLPLEMVKDEGAEGGNPFFRNKLMWVGVGIPVVVHTLNAFHTYFPAFPGIDLKAINITQGLVDRPWNSLNPLSVYIYFSVIGFSYLLSQEVGLSLWLFYLLGRFQSVIASAVGYQDPGMMGYGTQAFLAHQGAGAFFVVVVYSVWLARRQLGDVARKGLGMATDADDSDEPIPYRAAFWGLILGTAVLVGWAVAAGMSVAVAIGMILLFYVIMIALSKFVADAGLLFVQASFRPGQMMTTAFGSAPLGPANLTIMNIVELIYMYDLRSFLMPSVMDGFRLADGPKLRRRSLFYAIAIAIVAGVIISYISTLVWIYQTGGIKMHPWFLVTGNQYAYSRSITQIMNNTTTDWNNMGFTGVGVVVCWLLMFMRQRYVGWPVHPIGYAMASTFPMMQMWCSIMIGWMMKSLILRYGGRRTYMNFRPIFLGLVLGEFGICAVWVVIDKLAGVMGHAIFPN